MALLPTLLSIGCAATPPPRAAIVKPASERTVKVATPDIPAATTPCQTDPAALCNSDEETGGVIAAFAAALQAANDKLDWLADWFRALPD